jgi:Spy/CpxP family protein refolding chaperone
MNTKLIQGLAICSLLFLTAIPAAAESGPRGEKDWGMRRTAMLQQRLSLNDEQADQVYEIFKSARSESPCKEVETFSAKKACAQNKRDMVQEKISKVLTPEQQAEFKKLQEKRKQRHAGRMHGRDRHDPSANR